MRGLNERLSVLLVDDEEDILITLERLLMNEDYDVMTALSGEEGLKKLLGDKQVGLIISDQRMPGMNGAEFLARSRHCMPNARRILLTGYSDLAATIDAINKGGAHRYIAKPWDDDELIIAIREELNLYREAIGRDYLNKVIDEQRRELEEWNSTLKKRLLQTTAAIREQSLTIANLETSSSNGSLYHIFDTFFNMAGDRGAMHARTVSVLATDVAKKMGLDHSEVDLIRTAALLHDIAKFTPNSDHYFKPALRASENKIIEYRQHCIMGEEFLLKLGTGARLAGLVRSHHEAFNGNGFPDGIKGEAIPIGARLIAIADHIDRAAASVSQSKADFALENTRYHANTLFDPALVPFFSGISRIVYFERKRHEVKISVETHPSMLVPGMMLSEDAVSSSNILIMPSGTVLDAAGVLILKSHGTRDPALRVYVQTSLH